jgi:Na+/melibiose symporter-like transporter
MGFGSFIRSTYYSEEPLNGKDYIRSRKFSILEGCTARTVFNLTSGAFLAGFASYLGAGDSFNGIIGAIPVLAAVIQLFSPLYFEKIEKRKLQVTILNSTHRLLLGLMVFIPFIAAGRTPRLILLAGMYFLAYLLQCFANPAASTMLIDLTPENIRGRYFGARESYLLAVGITLTLIMGIVMDAFKDGGNQYGGFIVMFSLVLAMAAFNFFFWSKIKEPPVRRNKTTLRISKIITIPLKDKGFRRIVLLYVIYNVGLQIGGPFFSVYMVTGLRLNYTFIMVMSMISTVTNVILVRVWGRIADQKSWVFVIKYSILLLGITHFLWFFANSSTAHTLLPFLHVMSGAAWAGITISTFNIQFTFAPEEGRTVYVGFNAALGGLMGFAGTLVGSELLIVFSNLDMDISGFTLGGMQIILSTSGVLLALCAAYIHFFIKQPDT